VNGPLAIEASGLVFRYPDGHRALTGVDLAIRAGERVALLGPNGAGKTTLARHLNGLLLPESGSVLVGGVPLGPATLGEVRRRVGLVFQETEDQLFMPTVVEDVAFGPANLGLRGAELEARVLAALTSVGAADLAARAPHHLSGGERRRIALATVLAMQPDVLVLDEPTSNLDPAGRRELATVLLGLDVAQLVITHDLPFALELCDRAVVMADGAVVATGRVVDVLSDADLLARTRLELPLGFDPAVGFARRPVRH